MVSGGACMLMQMVNPDNYVFTVHAVLSLLVGSAIALLGIYVFIRECGSHVGVVFLLFTLCLSIWLAGFGMVYASILPAPALCWIRLNQMSVTFIPAAVLALAAALVQRVRQFRTLVRASVVVSSFFCAGVAATDLHIKGLYHYFWGYFPRYGPLGIIFLIYFAGIMIFILSLYWNEYRKAVENRRRKRLKGMFTAFGIGYLASLDFFAAFAIPLYPVGYVAISFFVAITAYVILRYKLSDITPEMAVGQLLETMQGAVIAVDLEGRIRVMNQAAQTMLGRQKNEVFGNHLTSIMALPPELLDYRGLREKNVLNHEMGLSCMDGRKIDVNISVSLVSDKDGAPMGFVYVAHDVTERRRSEEQLRKYSAELKQSNEDVLSFAYIVSHDLRAPLVSIKGFAGELQRGLRELDDLFGKCARHLSELERGRITAALRDDVPEAMKFIGSSVDRMERLISATLTLSRLGQRTLKPEPVDMKETAKAILSSLEHQIEQHKTTVTIGELPVVMADRFAMEQILGNLLDNALKYLEPGRAGTLAVTAEKDGDETLFHVSDNGRGIAKDDMHKVFELFRRAGKQDVPGEGMGLAYVKTLVRRHGGRIWFESEPGRGTIFSFTVSARFDGNQPIA